MTIFSTESVEGRERVDKVDSIINDLELNEHVYGGQAICMT